MKRTALIKYILENNCILFKEGSNHSVYIMEKGYLPFRAILN